MFPPTPGECFPLTNDSEVKTGALVLDTMQIGYYASTVEDYEYQLLLSILRMIQWLQDNVLDPYPGKGHFLREKLSKGVEFNEDMNSYLINSYRHWREQIGRGMVRQTFSVNISITHCLDPSCQKCRRLQHLLE
jgi:hypothetical protein